MIKETTDATFVNDVLTSPIPTLVDFWASWCGPCQRMAIVLEDIAQEYRDQIQVVKMDVDKNIGVPSQLGITSIPTLILFVQGREVGRVVGYRPKQLLVDFLTNHLTENGEKPVRPM